MQRCANCNCTLGKTEVACYTCGTPVKPSTTGSDFIRRFSTLLKFAFFASAGLTVASLFVDMTPPFMKCLFTTITILVVKSSADQMTERKGK